MQLLPPYRRPTERIALRLNRASSTPKGGRMSVWRARAGALLFVCCVPVLYAGQSSGPVLSLDTAVTLARQQNRTVAAERLDVEKATQQLAAFSTRRLPEIDVNMATGFLLVPLDFRFPQGIFGQFAATGPIPPQDTTIRTDPKPLSIVLARVTQPLTQLRRIDFGVRALALSRDIASERVDGREAEIVAGVKKLYYGIVQAEAGLRARQESVRLHRELARVVEQYAKERAVLPAELLSVRATLMKEEHQLAGVRDAASEYRERLNVLLGRGIDEPFEVEPLRPIEVTGEDLREAEAQAAAERMEVRISRLQSEQAEFDLRATRTPFMPDISASFNYAGFYGFEVIPRHGAFATVLATWEPWDWGRTRAERQEKMLVRDKAGIAAKEAEAMVRLDVRTRFRDLHQAFDLIQVTAAARDAAREQFRIVTERFRQEAALERELLEAQARLAQSDLDSQQALAAYWSARAEFERARGDQ